jgi:twitching motility protein PilT
MPDKMDLLKIFDWMIRLKASDVHLQMGVPPMMRVGGLLRPLDLLPVTPDDMAEVITIIADEDLRAKLRTMRSHDFSYTIPEKANFRVNYYHQAASEALVFRYLPVEIPKFEALNLPPVLQEIAEEERGIVLVTGTTGSGKSTTLAAMIDYINERRKFKIITIEDPIEYVHACKKSMVSQVEVGRDIGSFDEGLMRALRQDPDVILVGELRDLDTMRVALRAADTGHLVFSTIHTTNASQTVQRTIAMFPERERELMLQQLSLNLEAVLSQRLARTADGKSRVPVVEILRSNPSIKKYILERRYSAIQSVVAGREAGMQTFDQHLVDLYRKETIAGREALRLSTNPEAVALALKGISAGDLGGGIGG